jgi:hypothetical protein
MKTSFVSLYLLTATLFAGSALAQSDAPAAAAPSATPPAPQGDQPFRQRTLERFDANHDGKLDDAERATARAGWEKRAGEFRSRGGPKDERGPGQVGGPRGPKGGHEFAEYREFREFRQFQRWKKMAKKQQHRHERMRSAMLQRFDHDGDHRLNDAERAEARAAGRQMRERFQAGRKQALERFDANHDGKLDATERQGMQQAWQKFLQQQPVVAPAPAATPAK